MKRTIILLSLCILSLMATAHAADTARYGNGVSLEKSTPVADLLAHPGDYIGKTVRVDGIITGVCKKRGCWIQISDEEGHGVRIKVEDGVIVFPADSMGKHASAEGVFNGIPVAALQKKHEKEHGEKHEACDSKPSGEMIYFIQGSGAVIDS